MNICPGDILAFLQWADDRAIRSGHPDPDTYIDQNIFEPDFFLGSDPTSATVCAPADASYAIDVGQALGFSDPVIVIEVAPIEPGPSGGDRRNRSLCAGRPIRNRRTGFLSIRHR